MVLEPVLWVFKKMMLLCGLHLTGGVVGVGLNTSLSAVLLS